ncbi:hypothetical protein G6F24_016426 [Rhizopus arrhizus]|nr:hypothetical protein G6F24_016426 [Rhizopus arrhizus]
MGNGGAWCSIRARRKRSSAGHARRGAPSKVGIPQSGHRPKRRWPRRLTSAPASIDTVAAFRPWRSFRPSVARGRRGHHRDVGRPVGGQFTDQGSSARCAGDHSRTAHQLADGRRAF